MEQQVKIRIDSDLKQQIEKWAKANGMSVSSAIRFMCIQFLEGVK